MYLLLEEVGSGSAGTAHLAVRSDERTDELFVVKQLRPQIAEQPEHMRRFEHEAAIAVVVDHPNVVEVVDVGLGAERPYIVMRYVEGPTLASLLRALIEAGRTISVPAAVGLVRQALAGLQALHDAKHPETGVPLGFVHRDLSPRNLIATRDGHVRLIDLGLGRSLLGEWQTEAGRVMGSIGYMPPEQLRAEGVDHRTDLWSIASVLFELITLEPYVPGRGRARLLNTMSVEPRSLRPLRPDVPVALDEVIQRALSSTPAARFESAASFSRALAETCAAEPPGEASALVEAFFGEELDERRHRLLEVALTVVQPLEITEAYERIASRPGVDNPRMFASYDATRIAATRVERPTTDAPASGAPMTVTPASVASRTAPITVAPSAVSAAVAPPTKSSFRAVGIAAVIGVLIGAAGVAAVLAPGTKPAPTAVLRPEPLPRVQTAPTVAPRATKVPIAPSRTNDSRRRVRRAPPEPARTAPTNPPEVPAGKSPIEAAPPTRRERVERLTKKLQTLRKAHAASADRLLMELTALELVTDSRRYTRTLERLEREAAALE